MTVNPDHIATWWQVVGAGLFEEPDHFFCLRGIGEKGTPNEGTPFNVPIQPALQDAPRIIAQAAEDWGRQGIAVFGVPGAFRQAKWRAEDMHRMQCIVCDLDSGAPLDKLEHLTRHLGAPTLVVESGGFCQDQPKLHCYWQITPTTNITGLTEARDILAVKGGGDRQFGRGTSTNPFGRIHQPIRIPGTIHAKYGEPRLATVRSHNPDAVYTLSYLLGELQSMPPAPGVIIDGAFSPADSNGTMPVHLSRDVREGGEDDGRTRWSEFSRVAGHYLHCASRGEMTRDEAKELALGWVSVHMKPAWPQERVEREWSALAAREDTKPQPIHDQQFHILPPENAPVQDEKSDYEHFLEWELSNWTMGAPPPLQWLVDGLVLPGEPHLLVSTGGAGKTNMFLELAVLLAAKPSMLDAKLTWCGREVMQGGIAVVIASEDGKDDLWRRVARMDPDQTMRRAAHGRVFVLPTRNINGTLPVTSRDQFGNLGPSTQWQAMINLLLKVKEQHGPIAAVCIDTLSATMAGNENSVEDTNIYKAALEMAVRAVGCAVLASHHIRKSNENPISTPQDMLDAVRGSSALPNAFRATLGAWEPVDWDRRLASVARHRQVNRREKCLFRLAVCKANCPDMYFKPITLYRNDREMFEDVTAHDQYAQPGKAADDLIIWLAYAVASAAQEGYPYDTTTKGVNSLYTRRTELPPELAKMGWRELPKLMELALEKGIVVRAAKGRYYDVPGGTVANEGACKVNPHGTYTHPDWGAYRLHQGEIVAAGARFEPEEDPF